MNERKALEELLDRRNEHPEQLESIDVEIWNHFGRTVAVWVLDMSGFSRLTQKYGITHYLAMIRRMQRIVEPVVSQLGGTIAKREADNLFAIFPDVDDAILCAERVQAVIAEGNRHLPSDWDLHVSIGIDWGRVLVIDGEDLFGQAMNTASKLGEDLASAGEVLVSTEAASQLKRARLDGRWERRSWEISGVVLEGLRLPRESIRSE